MDGLKVSQFVAQTGTSPKLAQDILQGTIFIYYCICVCHLIRKLFFQSISDKCITLIDCLIVQYKYQKCRDIKL